MAEAVDRRSRLSTKCLTEIVESWLRFHPPLLTSRWLSDQHALLDRLERPFPAVQVFAVRSRLLGRQHAMSSSHRLQPLPLPLWSATPSRIKAIYTTTMMKSLSCSHEIYLLYAGDNPNGMHHSEILASPPVPFGAIGFTCISRKMPGCTTVQHAYPLHTPTRARSFACVLYCPFSSPTCDSS